MKIGKEAQQIFAFKYYVLVAVFSKPLRLVLFIQFGFHN